MIWLICKNIKYYWRVLIYTNIFKCWRHWLPWPFMHTRWDRSWWRQCCGSLDNFKTWGALCDPQTVQVTRHHFYHHMSEQDKLVRGLHAENFPVLSCWKIQQRLLKGTSVCHRQDKNLRYQQTTHMLFGESLIPELVLFANGNVVHIDRYKQC
jgi:hypothetical protein